MERLQKRRCCCAKHDIQLKTRSLFVPTSNSLRLTYFILHVLIPLLYLNIILRSSETAWTQCILKSRGERASSAQNLASLSSQVSASRLEWDEGPPPSPQMYTNYIKPASNMHTQYTPHQSPSFLARSLFSNTISIYPPLYPTQPIVYQTHPQTPDTVLRGTTSLHTATFVALACAGAPGA